MSLPVPLAVVLVLRWADVVHPGALLSPLPVLGWCRPVGVRVKLRGEHEHELLWPRNYWQCCCSCCEG